MRRKRLLFIPSFGVLLAGTMASAQSYTPVAEGSTPTHRSQVDTWSGQVYLYVGGPLPAGTNLLAFQYLFDFTEKGPTKGYITPLLFEYRPVEAFTVFTVVGIGKGFEVELDSVPREIPLEIVEGIKAPTGGNFTFGYINAMVDSSGTPVSSSYGTVDMDNPADTGEGAGGVGTTNAWMATANLATPTPVVALGTTFGAEGADVDYTFVSGYRTYSARAVGIRPAP
jgi:hypothetical protein